MRVATVRDDYSAQGGILRLLKIFLGLLGLFKSVKCYMSQPKGHLRLWVGPESTKGPLEVLPAELESVVDHISLSFLKSAQLKHFWQLLIALGCWPETGSVQRYWSMISVL